MSFDQLFDDSDANLLPAGASECAANLSKYNEWRRGDWEHNQQVEMPHPREIGLNIDFAVSALEAMAGHDHLMVIAATRYCIGRMSYIVGDCADWLIKIWPILNEKTKSIIQRDIEEEFRRDDEARADERPYKPLGMDCDRQQWEKVRALWSYSGGKP